MKVDHYRFFMALFVSLTLVTACGGDENNGDGDNVDSGAAETDVDAGGTSDEDTSSGGGTDVGASDTGMGAEDTTAGGEDGGAEDSGNGGKDTGGEDAGSEDTSTTVDTGNDTSTDSGYDGGSDAGSSTDTTTDDGGTTADGVASDATDGGTSDTTTDTTSDGGTTTDAGDTSSADGDATSGEYSIRKIRSLASNLQPGKSLSGTYRVENVVVTAVRLDSNGKTLGVYVQEPSGAKENSGIFVFVKDKKSGVTLPSNLQRGTVLNLEGEVLNYDDNNDTTNGGLLELHKLSTINATSQSGTVPTPVSISDPAVIGTYNGTVGSKAEALESVLVEVTNVHVIDENPDGPSSDYEEFVVGKSATSTDGVRVDDLLYDYDDSPRNLNPSKGDTFSRIRGPLGFTYDHTKIIPRDKGDLKK